MDIYRQTIRLIKNNRQDLKNIYNVLIATVFVFILTKNIVQV